MTREQMIAMIAQLGDDASFYASKEMICVTIEDFEGFDDNWDEVFRDYDVDAVENFLETLERTCTSHEGNLYHTYYFDNFDVEIGYTSFDI